jgi:eukaryotic translation initiation factor 2C
MAGPAKKRAIAEKQSNGSSNGSSSDSRDPTQRSEKSIPRLDGNRDPNIPCAAADYSDPRDLKNISDFLGLGGWYTARGVSTSTLLSQPQCASCTLPCKHLPSPHRCHANTFRARILPLSAWLAA